MKIPSQVVIAAVADIDLVPSRAGIPSSEFIRLRSAKGSLVFALSSEVFGEMKAKADTSEDWTAYVDRSSFVPFVNASKETNSKAPFEFKFSGKTGQLVVKCGRRKGEFNEVKNVDGYTTIKKVEGHKLILTSDEKSVLVFASRYATPDPTHAKLNCVYLDKKGWVLASNDKAAIRIKDPRVKATMPLPLGILPTLQHESVESVAVTDRLAKIVMSNGYLCQLVNQKAAKHFPAKSIHNNFEAAKAYRLWFRVQANKLVPALTRLMNYTAMVIRRDPIVGILGSKGDNRITLQCEVPQGKFEERVQIKKKLKQDVKLEWLLNHVTPLSSAGTDGDIAVHFEDGTPYYVHGRSFDLLVARYGEK